MSGNNIRIAMAQINPVVGDIDRNRDMIINTSILARDTHAADIIVYPELAITGYPPEDLLYRSVFYLQIKKALDEISRSVKGIDIILGYPHSENNHRYNACVHLRDGQTKHIYFKQLLPNYGVFDEKRYFDTGTENCIFDIKGTSIALSICEDIWDRSVCEKAARAGARLMLNLNASPYHIDKLSLRKQILKQRVNETGLNIAYINMVGGQDELVFDGGSMAIDCRGKVAFQAPQFREELYVVDYSPESGGQFSSPEYSDHIIKTEESIYQALVLGVRDYVTKNGFNGTIIGLSGGIDSALTLCIAVDALGKDNVETVIMPSRYTSSISMEDAQKIAALLGVRSHIISIEQPFTAFTECLRPVFENLSADTTEENIQARCRGIILMAISNKTGKMVLTTGNKSEMSVGYATLYGDMAGGFAPLKDVSKTLVYKLSHWRNGQSSVIPQRIIDRPPTAELRENQLDQDSLPPYNILDPILERYIELDQSPETIIKAGFDSDTVKKVVMLVDRNEYKRRQAAPGVKITQRAFGRDRRYPITSGYRE